MKGLSSRQEQILNFIEDYQEEKGYSPSVREIADAVGLASGSTAHGHLDRMEKKGYIRRDPSKPRTLEIVESEQGRERYVHFYTEGMDQRFVIPESLSLRKGIVLASVTDNGMELAGIKKGDTVLVQLGQVSDGDIAFVALRRPYKDVVRRVYRNGRQMSLEVDSRSEKDMLTSDAEVIGKVVGVIHLLEDDSFNM